MSGAPELLREEELYDEFEKSFNFKDFNNKINNIFQEQYEEIFPNLLIKNNIELINELDKKVKQILSAYFSNKCLNNKSLIILLNKIKTVFYSKIKEDYIFINDNYQNYKNNKLKYNFLTSFLKHCADCEQFAYHNCILSSNKFIIIIQNSLKKYVICENCKKVYKQDYILAYCNHCSMNYYTKIIEPKDNDNLQLATWKDYHCPQLINEKMKCIQCREYLYLDLNKNILKCLNKTCNFTSKANRIIWSCVSCSQEFTSEAIVFNPLDTEIVRKITQQILCLKTKARPKKVPCCQLNINARDFYHKLTCPGILYSGELRGNYIVLCERCKAINFYERFIWTCPECGSRFRDKRASSKFRKSIKDSKRSSNRSSTPLENVPTDNKNETPQHLKKAKSRGNFKRNSDLNENIIKKKFFWGGENKIREKIRENLVVKVKNPPKSNRNFKDFSVENKTQYNDIEAVEPFEENSNKLGDLLINRLKLQKNKHISIDISQDIEVIPKKENENLNIESKLTTNENAVKEENNNSNVKVKNVYRRPIYSKFFRIKEEKEQEESPVKQIRTPRTAETDVLHNKLSDSGKLNNTSQAENKAVSQFYLRRRAFIKGPINKNIAENVGSKSMKVLENEDEIKKNINVNNNNENKEDKNIFYRFKNRYKTNTADAVNEEKSKNTAFKVTIDTKESRLKQNVEDYNNLANKSTQEHKDTKEKKEVKISIFKRNKLSQESAQQPKPDSKPEEKKSPHFKQIIKPPIHNKPTPSIIEQATSINKDSKKIVSNFASKKDNTTKNSDSLSSSSSQKSEEEDVIANFQSTEISEALLNHSKKRIANILNRCKIPEFQLEEYILLKKLGEGSGGVIYSCHKKGEQKKYALKKILAKSLTDISNYTKEFELLHHCNHTNIIKIYGINIKNLDATSYCLYVLMELAKIDWDREIRHKKSKNLKYSENELIKILKQLVNALLFLQQQIKITHRDIKPQNILIIDDLYKIADFGEAKEIMISRKKNTLRGTELYMSPMLYDGLKHCTDNVVHNPFKSDVFSLGLCFLYAGTTDVDLLYKFRNVVDIGGGNDLVRRVLKGYSQQFVELIIGMLEYDEKKRYDFVKINQILEEKYGSY